MSRLYISTVLNEVFSPQIDINFVISTGLSWA